MLKRISTAALAVALAGVLAAPALAQKPGDKLPVLVTGPDKAVIKEAAETVKAPGECSVEFIVGKDGKPKNMKPTCTNDAYLPFVERAMAMVLYEPEIFDGEVFESEPKRQPFKFGVTQAATPAGQPGDKAPVVIKNIDPRDIKRALDKINEAGTCNAVYTVAADGKTKDIQPNCTPEAFNPLILEAIKKMTFKPGEKAGKAIDWPGMQTPMNLTKKD